MKVYIATKYASGKTHAANLAEYLEVHGHTITYKWWETKQTAPAERKTEESSAIGHAETCGVLEADIVLAVLNDPDYAYKGTLYELGMAVGARKKTIVITTPDASAKTHVVFRVPAVNTHNILRSPMANEEGEEDWTNMYPFVHIGMHGLMRASKAADP